MSADTPVDLAHLLRRYAGEQERAADAAAPEPAAEVLLLAGKVRRRRMMRTGSIAAAGVAAALVGAVAVYGVTRPDPIPPAPQPTETETFDPAPSPTPSQRPTTAPTQAPTEPDDVTRHALLPDVEPVPAGVWAETDADWLLGGYTAQDEAADGSSMTSPKVLYLVGPDGTAYEVPVPEYLRPADEDVDWQLNDWRPGDSRAVISVPQRSDLEDADESVHEQRVVDLATGEELVDYPAEDTVILLPDDRTLVMRRTDAGLTVAQVHDRDGYHLSEIGPFAAPPYVAGWQYSRGWAVDPSRTQLLLETPDGLSVFDISGLEQLTMPTIPAPAESPCSGIAWLEHNRLVVRCAEQQDLGEGVQGLGSHLWIANLGDGSTRRLTTPQNPDGSFVTDAWQVGAAVVVNREGYESSCGQQLAVVARDGAQNLVAGTERLHVTGVRNGRLVAETYSCEGGEYGALVSLDVGTAQVSMILPRVEGANVYFEQGAADAISSTGGWW